MVRIPNASDILNIYFFLNGLNSLRILVNIKEMLGKVDHGIAIIKKLKFPNFLAVFKNMLVQRILVETIEYMPLNFALIWSTKDILSHQQ